MSQIPNTTNTRNELLIWNELDRPIKYAIYGERALIILPVKVYSMAPSWTGACYARTLTLLDSTSEKCATIDYHHKDVFETEEGAMKEAFKRRLKGKR